MSGCQKLVMRYTSKQSFESAANGFHKRMEVTLLEKNTNAVQIFLEDVSPERGKDFLYTLIKKYNENGIDDKQLVSAKTVEFINDRLQVINKGIRGYRK